MFAAFKMNLPMNLPMIEKYTINTYSDGKALYNAQKQNVRKTLDAYVSLSGSLNTSELEKDWFPSVKADVFLSHSHKDLTRVLGFAGYLKSLGITAFIDSCVWGYADDLLRQIDDRYSTNSLGDYDYSKRNNSTAHVHMILNGALLKVMDKTECLIFLDTPNSLKTENLSRGITNSCWIYSELLMSEFIKRKPPIRKTFRMDESFAHSGLSVDYDVNTNHLIELSASDVALAAQQSGSRGKAILDQLYFNKKIQQ